MLKNLRLKVSKGMLFIKEKMLPKLTQVKVGKKLPPFPDALKWATGAKNLWVTEAGGKI